MSSKFTRKGFFRALFGFGVSVPVVAVSVNTEAAERAARWLRWERMGLFTRAPNRARRLIAVSDCLKGRFISGTRVLLDGKDISQSCFRAECYSDGLDNVGYYVLDAEGNIQVWRGSICRGGAVGHVEIIKPPNVSDEQWRAVQERWIANA